MGQEQQKDLQNQTGNKLTKGKLPPNDKPPTESQVLEYAHSRGRVIDAGRFVDFYQAKNWVVGKAKMKCWKSAVRNWIRNAPKFEPAPTPEQLAQRNSALVNSNISGWLE